MATYYFKGSFFAGGSYPYASWADARNWFTATNGGGSSLYALNGNSQNPGIQSTDNVIFDQNSLSSTQFVQLAGANRACANIDMTGFNGTIYSGNYDIQVYGTSIILPAIGTSGVFDPNVYPGLDIKSGTTTTITTNGQTVGTITISNGSTLVLQDDLTSFNNVILTIDNGTFNANDKNVTLGGITDTSSTSNKTITMGSGRWILGGEGPANNAFTIWNIQGPSYFTLNKDTSKIRIVGYSGVSSLYYNLASSEDSGSIIKIVGALTQATVNAAAQYVNWPSSGIVLIDDEYITYTGLTTVQRNEVNLTIGSRGYYNTSKVTHNAKTAVLLIYPQVVNLVSTITSSSTTSIGVSDVTAFGGGSPLVGHMLIDDEVIYYRNVDSVNKLLGTTAIERGTIYGGQASKHNAGAKVMTVQSRIFNDGGKSYPPIEVWSTGSYFITDFTGNGTSSGGGFSNITLNFLGPQQIQFGTYMSPTETYYVYKPQSSASTGDFFETFWYRDHA